MLRFFLVALFPSIVKSQCTTCNQANTNGQYGSYIYGSYLLSSGSSASPQRDAGQYMCNTCQMSTSNGVSGAQYNAPQYSCNSCQYSPSLQATTTMSPQYNMGQCTCNNCQLVQGVQYSAPQYQCSSCQQNSQSHSFSSTVSPYSSQIYRDSSSNSLGVFNNGCPNCQYSGSSSSSYGHSSTTAYPSATQQYRNTNFGTGCPSCQQSLTSSSSSTATPGPRQLYYNPSNGCPGCGFNGAYSSSATPNPNQQFRSPSNSQGFSSPASPYSNQQFQDPSLSNSPTSRYNELTNTNLGYPFGYQATQNNPGFQPLFDQSSTLNQNNDGTYQSGQYLPGTQGHVYDSRVGLTQFNTQV